MGNYSILELNSFLTKLTQGYDETSALAIIDAFHKLPISGNKIVIKKKMTEDTSFTGYTNEVGDTTIPNKDTKEVVIGEKSEEVVRVGHYKVKQRVVNDDESFIINWHHFWASDINTMNIDNAPPPIFGIEYLKEGLKPIALIRWDFVLEVGTDSWTLVDWLKSFKVFILNWLMLSRTHEFHKRFWVAKPTIIFGQSKMKLIK